MDMEGAEEIRAPLEEVLDPKVGDCTAADLGDDGHDATYDAFEFELHGVEDELYGREAHANATMSSSLLRVGNEFMVGNFLSWLEL